MVTVSRRAVEGNANAGKHHEIETRYRWHAHQQARYGRYRSTAGASFAFWQRIYHERGIAIFPVRVVGGQKKPAIKGWQRVGLPGSAELAQKFPDADAFGFCPGPRSRVTVLDVDTNDERVLRDALDRYGQTPIIVRTGSGNYQAWYRHHGEGRRIRPFAEKPIDVLGSGFVVTPASAGSKSNYQFIEGGLDDLDRLPVINGLDVPSISPAIEHHSGILNEPVTKGRRNTTLWQHCMRAAHHCDSFEALLDVARTRNEEFEPPTEDAEIMKAATSAWNYTERGENWLGRHGAFFDTAEVEGRLVTLDSDAVKLLLYLRAKNGKTATFMIANGLASTFLWTTKRLAAARACLIGNHVERARAASQYYGSALYRWIL